MSPAELAAKVLKDEPSAYTFRECVEAHLLHGWLVSTPSFFVAARPVHSLGAVSEIVNPWVAFPESECDAWHVWLCAGDLKAALACLPYDLPRMSFERANVLKFYPLDRLRKKLAKGRV